MTRECLHTHTGWAWVCLFVVAVSRGELGDLPLRRRVGAALNVLDLYPCLSVEQRHDLVCAALWPAEGTTLPTGRVPVEVRVRTSERDRAVAVDLVTRLYLDEEEVASRYCVTTSTVRTWVRRARL